MTRSQTDPATARRRALRPLPVLLIAAALLPATAACGPAAPAPAPTSSRSAPGSARGTGTQPGSVTAPARGGQALSVLSASFVSASAGWLLATPCASLVRACRTTLIRKTADGGSTWTPVPAPGAPPGGLFLGSLPADAVSAIRFTSARAGWVFGPALWQTRDGGASWRKLNVPGGPVQDLAVAGGRVLLVTGRCAGDGSGCGFRVYSAAAGSDAWQAVPGAAGSGVRSAQLAVSGGAGYLFAARADLSKPVLLTGPLDGAGRWRPLPDPCGTAWSGALAAAPGGWLFLGCGQEPGAGQQLKTAYLSADGGRDWRQVASPPSSGYLGGASMSPGGTIFLSGGRMDVYVSRDRGHSWHDSPSLLGAASLAGAGFPLTGATITSTQGFAFQQGVGQRQLWLTGDGGRHWTPVTVR